MENSIYVWLLAGMVCVLVCIVFCSLYIRLRMRSLERKNASYHSIVNQSLETFAHAIDAKDKDTNGNICRREPYRSYQGHQQGIKAPGGGCIDRTVWEGA